MGLGETTRACGPTRVTACEIWSWVSSWFSPTHFMGGESAESSPDATRLAAIGSPFHGHRNAAQEMATGVLKRIVTESLLA